MTKPIHAWLLTPLGVPAVIVAKHEVQHFITQFQALHIPLTPAHCSSAIIWQEQIVPILNLGVLAEESFSPDFKLAVLAYQLEPLAPLKHIALAVREPPERITVSDDDVCDLPEGNSDLWQFLAKSCVTYQGTQMPIINIAMLDSVELRRYAEHAFTQLGPTLQLSWKNTAAMSKASVKLVSIQNQPKPAPVTSLSIANNSGENRKIVSPDGWNEFHDMGKDLDPETEFDDEDFMEEFDDDWDDDELDNEDLQDDLDDFDDDLDDDLDDDFDDDLDDDWDEVLDDDDLDDWDVNDLDDEDLNEDDWEDDDLDSDLEDDYDDEDLDDDDLADWDDETNDEFDIDDWDEKKAVNSRLSIVKKSQP